MIGLITNLSNNTAFLKHKLATTKSADLLKATGGNTGNVAFVHAVQSILADEYQIIEWGSNPEVINQQFDRLVICCANQIGSHVDLANWGHRLEKFNLPVVLIGLGAQSNIIGNIPEVPQGSVDFLKTVGQLNANSVHTNIATRGEFSSAVLAHHGIESSPIGCPSLLFSKDPYLGQTCLKNQSRKNIRIMVPAGNPYHPSGCIEKKLVELVNAYHGEYVLQHPELLFNLLLDDGMDITESQIGLLKKVYPNFNSIEELKDWLKANSVFFADAPNWLNYSRKFTTVIGPRYHGVALPLQVGIPGKVIAIDSRTEELALTTGVPYIGYQDVLSSTTDELAAMSYWTQENADHFDSTRRLNSRRYVDFLNENSLTPTAHLSTISKE